jgi:zinc D-Ala-D-Ala dipeptidase
VPALLRVSSRDIDACVVVNELLTGMFGPLTDLRARPLPDMAPARQARLAAAGLRVATNAVGAGELLVKVGDYGVEGRNHYAHPRNPPYWRAIDGAIDALWVRQGVAARLAMVDQRLRAQGLRLHLFDAWRPRAVQAFFHDVWLPAELRARRPDLAGDALRAEVARYWAAPTVDAAFPAPHATGGAVDLTITFLDGEPLWMGSLLDDASALAATDRFEADGAEWSFSDEEARANRRLLYWLMIEAGFVNLPDEWWHFSFGDRLWAAMAPGRAPLYGLAEPPA